MQHQYLWHIAIKPEVHSHNIWANGLSFGLLTARGKNHSVTELLGMWNDSTHSGWVTYRKISNISRTKSKTQMLLESACSCLCAIYWSQVLSGEWRCSWGSADRWCSNYIWAINNLIAYKGATYIRDLTVYASVNYAILVSDNGMLPVQPQAIIWISTRLLLHGPLGTNFMYLGHKEAVLMHIP